MTAAFAPATEFRVFWAPTPEGSMLEALDLAGIEPGTRFLDLGCGDGRVLIEAAKRGASVRGIDIDPEMAEVARARLEEAGIPGTVEVADIAVADLCADVIYA